jgi:N-acetylgalactosamine-6-sulfatase
MKSLVFFSLVLFALVLACPRLSATNKPNIVFLFADDMGWGDLHCYGHPYAKTPNLDRLAADGTRFLQCYATGVTCCPSRTGFMTGKFPATFARYPSGAGFGDRVTITGLLKRHGYATAHFGKWHIGPDTTDGTYGIGEIGSAEGGKKKQRADEARGRDAHLYDSAIRFIERHKDGPFYINIWDHIPHHPINPSQAVLDAFGPLAVDESKFPPQMREKLAVCKKLGGDVSEHMRAYLAEVKAMDAEIGRLLKRLDDLGLRGNTLVAFSSDQGPAHIRDASGGGSGEKAAARKERKRANKNKTGAAAGPAPDPSDNIRLNAMGFAGPFRGGKHNQYEGGVRIPFIVRWPGHVPAGKVSDALLTAVDWLPTVCGLTGIQSPPETSRDGEDIADILRGVRRGRRKPLFWEWRFPVTGHVINSSPMGAVRDGKWKLLMNPDHSRVELYDIPADPSEMFNVAAQHPDEVERLAKKLTQWQALLPQGPVDPQAGQAAYPWPKLTE